jgi:sulfur carrier protein
MTVMTVWLNGERRELATGTTLERLVTELTPPPPPTGVAAAVNETVIPRGRWAGTALADGDRIELLTAVQGG